MDWNTTKNDDTETVSELVGDVGTDDVLIFIARITKTHADNGLAYSIVTKSKKSIEHPNIEAFNTEIILHEALANDEHRARRICEGILEDPTSVESYHEHDDYFDEDEGWEEEDWGDEYIEYDDGDEDDIIFLDEDIPY